MSPSTCPNCGAASTRLVDVPGHPTFLRCLDCTELVGSIPIEGGDYHVGIDWADGPDESVMVDNQGNVVQVDECEDDLECLDCQETELVVLRGHDPSGRDEGPIVGFYCRACGFRHTGTIASLQERRQPDTVTTGMVMRLLSEDQRKGAPGGGGGCKVRRRPKAGEKAAWKEARRARGTDNPGGRSGLSDNQVARLKARKTEQLAPTRVDPEEKQVIKALQATGLNESESVRTCINTFGRAVKVLDENEQLRAKVAELEAQLAGKPSGWQTEEVS